MLSVAVRSAVKITAELTEVGVHVHVPVVEAALTVSHPGIAVPPALKRIDPGVLTVAVTTTGVL